jgi:hypothetical protein
MYYNINFSRNYPRVVVYNFDQVSGMSNHDAWKSMGMFVGENVSPDRRQKVGDDARKGVTRVQIDTVKEGGHAPSRKEAVSLLRGSGMEDLAQAKPGAGKGFMTPEDYKYRGVGQFKQHLMDYRKLRREAAKNPLLQQKVMNTRQQLRNEQDALTQLAVRQGYKNYQELER